MLGKSLVCPEGDIGLYLEDRGEKGKLLKGFKWRKKQSVVASM